MSEKEKPTKTYTEKLMDEGFSVLGKSLGYNLGVNELIEGLCTELDEKVRTQKSIIRPARNRLVIIYDPKSQDYYTGYLASVDKSERRDYIYVKIGLKKYVQRREVGVGQTRNPPIEEIIKTYERYEAENNLIAAGWRNGFLSSEEFKTPADRNDLSKRPLYKIIKEEESEKLPWAP